MPASRLGVLLPGLRSLCFFPISRDIARPDLGRRLTPIRTQSQRINIFCVFNRRYRAFAPFLDSHIAACGASARRSRKIAHVFECSSPRLRQEEKAGDELQRHHAGEECN